MRAAEACGGSRGLRRGFFAIGSFEEAVKNVLPFAAVGLRFVEDLKTELVILKVFAKLLPGYATAGLIEVARDSPLVVDQSTSA